MNFPSRTSLIHLLFPDGQEVSALKHRRFYGGDITGLPAGTVLTQEGAAYAIILRTATTGVAQRALAQIATLPVDTTITINGLRALYAHWSTHSDRLKPLSEDESRGILLAAAIAE